MISNKKTAAVYDRWLFTLGGGEQVAFAYAEVLRDLGFETSILTHKEVDIEKAHWKMGVNLKDIKVVYLPLLSTHEMSAYTEQYDVFINTSYLDYFPNRSKCGLLSIFFPSQIVLSPYEYIKRAVVLPSFHWLFIYPSIYEGFRFDEYKKGKIYKWLGEKSSIVFNKDIGELTIELFFRTLKISSVDGVKFMLGNEEVVPVTRRMQDRENIVSYHFCLKDTAKKHFSILLPKSSPIEEVALVRLTIHSFRYVIYNLFKRFFPKWEMRLHGGPGVTKLSDLTSYQRLVTISDFSKHWIKKYWGLNSDVLYPPVSVEKFAPAKKKKNWIIHVGRFFVTGHSKKQLDLVKVFRRLIDEKGLQDWELHFVGSVHEGRKHQQYFEQVKYYAQGYPVFFHLDVPFAELQTALAESKIYWHATGLDENENTNPILFEHFGITTVEAMASGCVPIVIHAGGQKEIVTNDNGFTWTNRDELLEKTFALTQNKTLLKELSARARERSKFFSRTQFSKRFEELLVSTKA
jgi:glycosyltransferase involved in cell wall biosynthesis